MEEATLREVVGQALAGERAALADLYRLFRRRVLGLCRYLLGSKAEAEDAASEIFARLPQAMKSYDSTLSFPRWLFSVSSHYCLDLLRRRRVEQRIFEPRGVEANEAAVALPSPLEALLFHERQEAVRAAITRLPERYRVPLVLRYYNELSYDEIATKLGVSRAGVGTTIFRAKQELRRSLRAARAEGRR
jgi:RNA polymerase sigma-70 factor (ECF subfamily)